MSNTAISLKQLSRQKFINSSYKTLKVGKTLVEGTPLDLFEGDIGAVTTVRATNAFNPYDSQTVGNNILRTRPIFFNNNTYNMRLVEPTRTNILTDSEDFSAWGQQINTSVSTNTFNGVDGTLTADSLIENTSNGEHYLRYASITTPGSLTTYTASVYVKTSECDRNVYLRPVHVGDTRHNTSQAVFNVTTKTFGGVSGNGISTFVENIDGDWYRVGISFDVDSAVTIQGGLQLYSTVPVYTGDGSSKIVIWGYQLEQGAFPTSYIKTTGISSTRNEDDSSISSINKAFIDKGTLIVLHLEENANLQQIDNSNPNIIRTSDVNTLNMFYNQGNQFFRLRRNDSSGGGGNGNQLSQAFAGNTLELKMITSRWNNTTKEFATFYNGGNKLTTTVSGDFITLLGETMNLGSNGNVEESHWVAYLMFEEDLTDAEIATLYNSMRLP